MCNAQCTLYIAIGVIITIDINAVRMKQKLIGQQLYGRHRKVAYSGKWRRPRGGKKVNYDIINIDDGIDGEGMTVQSTRSVTRSGQFMSGTSKKGHLFYIRNESDKEEVTMMLEVFPSY